MERNNDIIEKSERIPTTQDIEIESLRTAQNALDNAYKENKRWFFAVLSLIVLFAWFFFAYFFGDYGYSVVTQYQNDNQNTTQQVGGKTNG